MNGFLDIVGKDFLDGTSSRLEEIWMESKGVVESNEDLVPKSCYSDDCKPLFINKQHPRQDT